MHGSHLLFRGVAAGSVDEVFRVFDLVDAELAFLLGDSQTSVLKPLEHLRGPTNTVILRASSNQSIIMIDTYTGHVTKKLFHFSLEK